MTTMRRTVCLSLALMIAGNAWWQFYEYFEPPYVEYAMSAALFVSTSLAAPIGLGYLIGRRTS